MMTRFNQLLRGNVMPQVAYIGGGTGGNSGTDDVARNTNNMCKWLKIVQIIRGLHDLNIVGDDLVEVSPLYDSGGSTALQAVNWLFAMLRILPRVRYDR